MMYLVLTECELKSPPYGYDRWDVWQGDDLPLPGFWEEHVRAFVTGPYLNDGPWVLPANWWLL